MTWRKVTFLTWRAQDLPCDTVGGSVHLLHFRQKSSSVIFNGHSKELIQDLKDVMCHSHRELQAAVLFVCSSVRPMNAVHITVIHFCAVHTDLFGCIWFQVVCFQQLDVKIFERLSEWWVDFVVQFCQLEELGIDWWDELRTGEFYNVFQYAE